MVVNVLAETIIDYLEYQTMQGDSFDTIALRYFNEEKLADRIMKANPDLIDTIIFDAGVKLKIPVIYNIDTPDSLPPWRLYP